MLTIFAKVAAPSSFALARTVLGALVVAKRVVSRLTKRSARRSVVELVAEHSVAIANGHVARLGEYGRAPVGTGFGHLLCGDATEKLIVSGVGARVGHVPCGEND